MSDTHYSTKFRQGKESRTSVNADTVWDGVSEGVWGDETPKNAGIYGEFWLWRAIISQALQDCASVSNCRKTKVARAKAIAWISLEDQDFLFVCDMAGIDPKHIIMRAREIIRISNQSIYQHKAKYSKARWKHLNARGAGSESEAIVNSKLVHA